MRVLAVDDEPLSRAALRELLSTRQDVEEFEVAEDAAQALQSLQKQRFDVLLLDIHMPEMSGLQLVETLRDRGESVPAVVFVTAHQHHAVEAFEKRAVDYVLKPFEAQRVHEALDVAVRRSAQERSARLFEALEQLRSMPARPARIAVKAKGRIVFLDASELVTAEAHGNYVLLQQKSGSYLLRETISGIADRLKAYGFIRIHRSVLVNSAFVEAIEPCVSGEYLLRTTTGKEYNVTRTYKDNLQGLAQFWIGTDGFTHE